jgi:hypothetical protein
MPDYQDEIRSAISGSFTDYIDAIEQLRLDQVGWRQLTLNTATAKSLDDRTVAFETIAMLRSWILRQVGGLVKSVELCWTDDGRSPSEGRMRLIVQLSHEAYILAGGADEASVTGMQSLLESTVRRLASAHGVAANRGSRPMGSFIDQPPDDGLVVRRSSKLPEPEAAMHDSRTAWEEKTGSIVAAGFQGVLGAATVAAIEHRKWPILASLAAMVVASFIILLRRRRVLQAGVLLASALAVGIALGLLIPTVRSMAAKRIGSVQDTQSTSASRSILSSTRGAPAAVEWSKGPGPFPSTGSCSDWLTTSDSPGPLQYRACVRRLDYPPGDVLVEAGVQINNVGASPADVSSVLRVQTCQISGAKCDLVFSADDDFFPRGGHVSHIFNKDEMWTYAARMTVSKNNRPGDSRCYGTIVKVDQGPVAHSEMQASYGQVCPAPEKWLLIG